MIRFEFNNEIENENDNEIRIDEVIIENKT